MAFIGTVSIFASLAITALLAKRKKFLFLGGFIFNALAGLLIVGVFQVLFPSIELFTLVQVYGGLAVLLLCTLYDTQMIIERSEAGERDALLDSIGLFIDFIGIFVRTLLILLRMDENSD